MRRRLTMLAACGMTLFLLACNASAGQTTISGGVSFAVTPDHAQRGGTITLNGRDWRPNSKITLAFSLTGQQNTDATGLGVTTADAEGRFTFVTIVPQGAKPGVWSIIVQGDVNQSASAFFTVEPGATAGAASAMPAPTDTQVPTDVAQPTDTPQPTSTVVPVTIINTPQTDPTLKATWRGSKLELQGDGWPAGEQVRIGLSKEKDGGNAISLGVLGANDQGQFSVSVSVPKQVRENWYVVASDASHRVIARIPKTKDD